MKTFNVISFLYVFKYIKKYVDVDKSFELEKSYMQDISNYRFFKLFQLFNKY